jgi:hypothetical protein
MASKKFLVDIDLVKNQLTNAKLQNLASHPTVTVGTDNGFVYWNTTDSTAYAYTGVGVVWLDLGQSGLTDGDYGDITVSGSGTVFTIDNDAVSYPKMQNVVADNVFLGNNSGAGSVIDELTGTEATAMLDVFTDALKGLVPASGGGTATFLRADGIFATPAGGFADFDAGGDSGADVTIDSGDLYDVTGDTGITTTISKAATTVTLSIDLDDTAVTTGSWGLAGSVPQFTVDQQGRLTAAANVAIGITESQITNLGTAITLNTDTTLVGNGWFLDDDTMAANDATKTVSQQSLVAYVASQVAGGVSYKGAFDPTAGAGAGSPDLDTITSETGDMYTVTVAGTYNWTTGSAELEVGDILIAESDGILNDVADWTILNKNIPEIVDASETAAGLVEEATDAEMSAGTAVGGTGAKLFVTPAKLETLLGTDDANLNVAVRYTEQIGDTAATSIVVTHNIGRQFVTAQIFETASTFNQAECEVRMTSTTTTTFVFNVAPGTNEYTVVIVG